MKKRFSEEQIIGSPRLARQVRHARFQRPWRNCHVITFGHAAIWLAQPSESVPHSTLHDREKRLTVCHWH
ncbi:hypothetical protein ACYJW8_13630 [Frateuria aurantia]